MFQRSLPESHDTFIRDLYIHPIIYSSIYSLQNHHHNLHLTELHLFPSRVHFTRENNIIFLKKKKG